MCVKLHIDKKIFSFAVFKTHLKTHMMMGKHHSKAKRNLITKLANETHFTEEEVRHWYKGFFIDCPGGRLSEKRFIGIYQRFFPDGDSTKFAKSVFRVFDENKDGLIEFDEFVKGLSIVTRGNLDEKLKWSFKLYDENSDGYLTKSEIFKTLDYIELLMQPIESRTQNDELINQIDENMPINELNSNDENRNKMNKNDIDNNEIIKHSDKEDNIDKINNDLTEESNSSSMERNRTLDIKLCKEKIDKIFQKIDKNSITMEQFLQLSKDDPELCKLILNLQP